MAKETNTRAEYLQFLGLDAMARQHSKKINDIRDSMYELLGTSDDDDKHGHISDLIWAGDSVTPDKALARLGIAVREDTDADS